MIGLVLSGKPCAIVGKGKPIAAPTPAAAVRNVLPEHAMVMRGVSWNEGDGEGAMRPIRLGAVPAYSGSGAGRRVARQGHRRAGLTGDGDSGIGAVRADHDGGHRARLVGFVSPVVPSTAHDDHVALLDADLAAFQLKHDLA